MKLTKKQMARMVADEVMQERRGDEKDQLTNFAYSGFFMAPNSPKKEYK